MQKDGKGNKEYLKVTVCVKRDQANKFKSICAAMGKPYSHILNKLIVSFNLIKGGVLKNASKKDN